MTEWNVTAAYRSDRGHVRGNNEDAVAADVQAGVFIVCDGMGGAAAGEIASRRTADGVFDAVQKNHGTSLAAAIASANESLFLVAGGTSYLHGMGTTIVALKLTGDAAELANVGDSRCYRLRGGILEQMTQDHSFVAEQMRRGLMTEQEAATSPMKSVITRAVGTCESVDVDTVHWQIKNGDIYLLASDGLTRELSDRAIAEVLREVQEPDAACDVLVAAANRAGGRDNVTCVVVRIASGDSI
jgi:serine/threonine protein phosphatase PrpC